MRISEVENWTCRQNSTFDMLSLGLEERPDHGVHLVLVDGELADALAELVVGHLVLVHHPPEGLLVHVQPVELHGRGLGGVQELGHLVGAGLKLGQQLGADGEQVAAGQGSDLGREKNTLNIYQYFYKYKLTKRSSQSCLLENIITYNNNIKV